MRRSRRPYTDRSVGRGRLRMDCGGLSHLYCCSIFGGVEADDRHPIEELICDFDETFPDEEENEEEEVYLAKQENSSALYVSPIQNVEGFDSGPATRELPNNQDPSLHNGTDSPYKKLLSLYVSSVSSEVNPTEEDQQIDATAYAPSQQREQKSLAPPMKSPFSRDFSRLISFSNLSPEDLPEES